MRLAAILIGAVSTVQAGQWDKCEEIRMCNCVPGGDCPETPFEGDCWMSTGSERTSNGEPSGKLVLTQTNLALLLVPLK